jgi:uncharacterized protein
MIFLAPSCITMARVGVISDTHGLLRPQALAFLEGCDHIIHGGDIGNVEVLTQLSQIAPVTAVRGNNDKGAWADSLPETQLLEIEGTCIYVLHDLSLLDIDPVAADVQVVVTGHSHKPVVERRDGVIYLNPGSAGPRRFRLPVSLAELIIDGGAVTARIVELELQGA